MIANAYTQRAILVVIGLLAFLLTLWLQASTGTSTMLAQSQSPLETFTPGPTPTLEPTPTLGPTPTKVRRVVNEIVAPKSGDAIAGWTNIVGTILVNQYSRYDIHISPSGMENWQWLVSSYAVIHDDVLYRVDTTQFPDGMYDLRARAIQDTGGYTESFVRGIEIRNANPPTLTPIPGTTVTALISPLATPTPSILSRIPNGQGIYAPDNGAVIRGPVDVVATVNGLPKNRFERYELAISPAGLEQWSWLYSGDQQMWQGIIFQLNTAEYVDGLYDLRLRNVYEDGNYSEYHVRNLSIANSGQPQLAFVPLAGIVSPRSGAEVSGTVNFTGSVPANDLLRWELAWAPGRSEQWNVLFSGENPMTNELLARLDLSHLSSGLYDFRLRIVRKDYNYSDYFVRDLRLLQ